MDSASCWGENPFGGIGDGTNTDRHTPTQTASLGINRTAVAISLGDYHTCTILDNGSVSCWGYNSYGQLGDGTTNDRNTPNQNISLGTDRTAIAIGSGGSGHTCAILDNLSVSCWGYNNAGRLGDGTTTQRNTPTQTSSLGTGRTTAYATIFFEHIGQSSQTACATGTYQPDSGQTSCDAADAGYYVDSIGSDFQTECSKGSYQPDSGQTSCDAADAGYYVDTTASTTQTACAVGTFQASTGQTSCDAADAGHYVDTTGSDTQTECPVGTYQPDTGQTSCDDADTGYYVDSTAQTEQTACSPEILSRC